MRSLPPLNALRAFESAARLGGFKAASEALHVTPAAVSHQVKQLESHLGLKLFDRLPRGLTLTEAGRQMLPELSYGLNHFERAVGRLRPGSMAGKLVVSALPSFASLWLVPRLDDFLRSYPEVELSIVGRTTTPDLDAGEVDLHIAYGINFDPTYSARLLMSEEVFPVCSPTLLNQSPLRRMSDLRNHRLLHDTNVGADEPTMTWQGWFRDAHVTDVQPETGVEFSDSIMLTEAAVRGVGVALGRTSLVGGHLTSGNLVRPLRVSRPADYDYYTVTTHAARERPRVQAMIDWLEEQAETEAALVEDARGATRQTAVSQERSKSDP